MRLVFEFFLLYVIFIFFYVKLVNIGLLIEIVDINYTIQCIYIYIFLIIVSASKIKGKNILKVGCFHDVWGKKEALFV